MKRVILLVVVILTIGSLIGGNVYWNQKVKATSEKAKESLQQNASYSNSADAASTNTATGSTESNKNGADSKYTSNNTDSKSNSTASNDKATQNENAKASTTNKGNAKDKKKTVASIKKEYNALFNELEAQETSKLDQLVVQAKADYISKKYSKVEIAAKYQDVLKQLEGQADQSFNAIYQQLQYDLDKNGHSLNEAQGYQQTYNAAKQKRSLQLAASIKSF